MRVHVPRPRADDRARHHRDQRERRAYPHRVHETPGA